jgi:RHS repeat-associated protein
MRHDSFKRLNDIGQLKTLNPTNGQSITYYYDYDPENPGDTGLGRLKDIEVGSGSGNKYTYGYTGVNRLIQSNDPLKRLTDIINKDSSAQVINSHSFTYNNMDLIDTETVTTGTAYPSQQQDLKTYDYNNVNQLLNTTGPNQTFTSDDDGNMTQGYTPAPDNYTVAMTYDAENRLASAEYTDSGAVVHRTEYFYSGNNFLAEIKKYEDASLVKTIRIVRAGFLPVQERDDNNSVTREYTWGVDMGGGIGGLLNLKQDGNDYSYLYDGKGNVMAVLNSTQSIVASYRYDEFGNLMAKTGTLDQPFMFSTKRYDQSTGTSYYGYRFYSPCTGRWITRDPLGEAGGVNLYGFVQNNPVNFFDPWGLAAYGDSDRGQFGPIPNTLWHFGNNYLNMRDANTKGADKYFHCMANCQAAREGPIGYGMATMISEGREFFDEYVKGDSPSVCNEDREANRRGRESEPNEPCKDVCMPLRPDGLDLKY